MKYGVLYFKNTLNLGDDVQTYASLKYLPKIDYYIDRENMDSFVPNEKEQIAVISNGWFVHKSLNFPPSPYILPLPISMHFSLKHVEDIQNEFFHLNNDFSLRYLKSIEPIMCRDSYTADLLRNKGIKSEYSGCMTLTIKKFDDVQKGEYICAVDISNECLEKLKSMTDLEIKVMTHSVDKSYADLSFEDRMKKVEDTLKIYQGAKYIVTTRLHVALPSTALGTKVLIIYDKYNEDRFGDFIKYIDFVQYYDFLKEDYIIDFNDNIPTDKYLSVPKYINKKCNDFIHTLADDEEVIDNLPSIENYNKYVIEKVNGYKDLCLKLEDKLINNISLLEDKLKNNIFLLEEEKIKSKNIENDLNNRLNKMETKFNIVSKDLNDILNRKMYKVLDKCTKVFTIFKRK